jgi:predicted nucleic acid-binding protein
LIYLDTSVALAQLLAEDKVPPKEIWAETLVSSRLIEYELWNRLHARGLSVTHAAAASNLLERIAIVELSQTVLARALEPFKPAVRTLDAMHLATVEYLRAARQRVKLATYDDRMAAAAKTLRIPLFEVGSRY